MDVLPRTVQVEDCWPCAFPLELSSSLLYGKVGSLPLDRGDSEEDRDFRVCFLILIVEGDGVVASLVLPCTSLSASPLLQHST